MSSDMPDARASRLNRRRWLFASGLWLLSLGALVALYHSTFTWMWDRWFPSWRHTHLSLYQRFTEGESYYTHGPLVPLISLIIVLLLVRRTQIDIRPRRLVGLLIIAFALLIHLGGTFARIDFVSGFSLVLLLAGVVVTLWGLVALKRFWFPLALLLFMVPLPEVTVANLNHDLKMFAANWGARLANILGTIAVQDDNRVWLEGGRHLVVANVCNGLRTLISVIGFGALYAYVCQLRGVWRALIFAASVPVAVVSNSIRIASLIIVADHFGVEVATGWYHDFSGLLIFIVALMLMFGIERGILWSRRIIRRPAVVLPLFHGVRRTDPQDLQPQRIFLGLLSPRGATLILLLIAASAVTWMLNRVDPPQWRGQLAAKAVPEQLLCDDRLWVGHALQLDERTLTILATNDYLLRRYASGGEHYVDFCIIFSQDNRKGTHPPDLCLQGSGEGIVHKADFTIDVPGVGPVPCRELVVQNGPWQEYFLYTYKCGNSYTNSFWVQQFTIFWNGLSQRNASGALIRLSTLIEPASRGRYDVARRRSLLFLQATMQHVHRNLP